MIIPTKHENLSHSNIVIGGVILRQLKRKSMVIEDLYVSVRDKHGTSMDAFFDVMLFLWLGGFVEVNSYEARIVRAVSHVS